MHNQEEDKKLDWMYKKPGQSINHEDYLLGKTIDKEFEALAQEERNKNQEEQGLAPKNHVEHECVPFSIRSYKNAPQDQVDMARKLQEDPLVAIKRKEMESRQQLLQNPVKLKELHRILKEEKMKKLSKKKKKKDSKPKKSKKDKSEKHVEKDLDDILAEKYAKLKATLDETLDMGSLLKNKQKDSGESQDSEDSDHPSPRKLLKSDSRSHRNTSPMSKIQKGYKNRNNIENSAYKSHSENYKRSNNYDERDNSRSMYRSRTNRSTDYRNSSKEKNDRNYRNRSPDFHKSDKRNSKQQNYDSCSDDDKNDKKGFERNNRKDKHKGYSCKNSSDIESNDKSYKNKNSHTSNRNMNDNNDKYKNKPNYDSDDERMRKSQMRSNYGLVTADGKKLELKKTDNDSKNSKHSNPKTVTKKHNTSHKRPRLTDEEIEARRKEMLENAQWRDKQLERNIKKYQEEDRREQDKNSSDFDTEFLKKQMARATEKDTLERRIKSNINNIQRSGRSMDMNFARR
ncbi:pre-mRNA-splicing factor CWC25 homolog [Ctenocephalides felis]|uniref:pre-mRNA-splicing factor CWC25 homolog n=1 Tax=Ctenocephalides felis TaxID=7515 RepID=UPI000E6E3702|nr:pre-mRNA-splicing factor CWC25 homolog [Ctenocephalides felis]XP_026473154.1 pre-mRNA-splicing factor CWC25 homolog [Ctenocephalides felis]XP_026473163.1 pre-mRNA-splicing factor CWC25 homolog [Ctenocephalides felis]